MSSPRPVLIFGTATMTFLLRLYRRGGTDVSRAFLEGEAKGQLDLPMVRQEDRWWVVRDLRPVERWRNGS